MNKKANKIIIYSAILASVGGAGFVTQHALGANKDKDNKNEVVKNVKRTSEKSSRIKLSGDTKEKDGIVAGDTIPFHMDYTVPNNVDFDSIELKDTLEDVLKSPNKSDVHVYLVESDGSNGEEITSKGTVTSDGQVVSWKTTDNPKQFAGKIIRIQFDASLKYGQNYDKYKEDGKIKIPNVGSMILHDKQNSKNVEVPTDKVYMTPNIIKNKQEKFIIFDDKEVKKEDNVQPGDTVHYELKFTITNDKDFTKCSIVDDLPDELDLSKDSIHILDKDKKDISDQFDIKVDESKESFEITPKKPRDWRGKDIIVNFDSKLKYDTSITDKKELDNTANLILDDEKLPTDKVTVTTHVVNPTAEKWITDQDGNTKKDTDASKKA